MNQNGSKNDRCLFLKMFMLDYFLIFCMKIENHSYLSKTAGEGAKVGLKLVLLSFSQNLVHRFTWFLLWPILVQSLPEWAKNDQSVFFLKLTCLISVTFCMKVESSECLKVMDIWFIIKFSSERNQSRWSQIRPTSDS